MTNIPPPQEQWPLAFYPEGGRIGHFWWINSNMIPRVFYDIGPFVVFYFGGFGIWPKLKLCVYNANTVKQVADIIHSPEVMPPCTVQKSEDL